MPKDYAMKALLKQHEELVTLYMHENKLRWEITSIYIAFNGILASAVGVMTEFKMFGAIIFLSLIGVLVSVAGRLIITRNRDHIETWIKEGIKMENRLSVKELQLHVFHVCEPFLSEPQTIRNGMAILALVWLIVLVGGILIAVHIIPCPML